MKTYVSRPAAALAALALVLTACSSAVEDEAVEGVETQPPTEDTAVPATTASPTTTTQAEAAPLDAMELLTAAFESSAGRSVRGELSMNMGGPGGPSLQFESDGTQDVLMFVSFDEMTGQDSEGFGMEILSVDSLLFARYQVPEEIRGLVGDELPEGWLTFDAATAGVMGITCVSAVPGATLGDDACLPPNDNTHMLEFMTSAEIIGPEDIDGEPTTHIRVGLDLVAMFSALSSESGGDDGSGAVFGDVFGDEFFVDAWIDADGLTRRTSVDLAAMFGDLAEGFGANDSDVPSIAAVMDYYEYDADVVIEAPPAGEIVGDLSDFPGFFSETEATTVPSAG